MKKLILVIAFLPFMFTLYGQETYSVNGIVEHFTNTDCPICGNVNPGFHTIRKQQENYLHLSIHPKYPYPTCELYQANKVDNTARSDYYAIIGTPTVVFNGTIKMPAASVVSKDFIDNLETESPLIVQVEDFRTENKVKVTVETNGNHPGNESLKLFVYMVEKTVDYTGNSGESIHYNVMRDIINDKEGTTISLEHTAGSRWVKEFNYAIDSDYDENEIYFLAYIQAIESGKIYNVHSSDMGKVITSTEDKMIEKISIRPNPVNSTFKFTLPTASGPISIKMYDLYGKGIMSVRKSRNLQPTYSISVSDLNPGVYTLVIQEDDKIYTTKLIKM